MKKHLRLTLAAAVLASLMGCTPDEETEGNIKAVDSPSQPAMSAAEKLNYDKALDGEHAMPATGSFDDNPDTDTDNAQTANGVDYKNIIDSEQGAAALEAGKAAIIAGIGAIDQGQVKALASVAIGHAGDATKKYADSAKAKLDSGAAQSNGEWQVVTAADIRVIDGDTVEVIYNDGRQSDRVRLLGIDAPEYSKNNPDKTQEYGLESKDSLEECFAHRRPITVEYKKIDGYGRLLGIVNGGDMDCNLYQIKQGAAWHYKQYQNEQPTGDAAEYTRIETNRRENGYGLWGGNNPVAPWEWRKSK